MNGYRARRETVAPGPELHKVFPFVIRIQRLSVGERVGYGGLRKPYYNKKLSYADTLTCLFHILG